MSHFWKNRRVLVTGHTGFKGSWLCLWLQTLGAEVFGVALEPAGKPNLYETASIGRGMESCILDIRDAVGLRSHLKDVQPECVFHLAAQPLVRHSYADPVGTFATNILGTAHLLDALRSAPSVRAAVIITTDKVYQNREWTHPYCESDALGGHDPYSASKAGAEIVAASFRDSFLKGSGVRVATARAGNVFGGGDWAADRLIPDAIRAFSSGQPLVLRNPCATRPWQHVLEPLAGYILLAMRLQESCGEGFDCAWNFGPDSEGNSTVGHVATRVAELWGGGKVKHLENHPELHEAGLLQLDSSRAKSLLGWRPRWSLEEGLKQTVAWYKLAQAGGEVDALMREQISAYQKL
jgi:CDP-glucose 4,6-dehydratase